MHGAVDERNAQAQAGGGEQVARGEIVGTVDDDVVAVQQPLDVRRDDALVDGITCCSAPGLTPKVRRD